MTSTAASTTTVMLEPPAQPMATSAGGICAGILAVIPQPADPLERLRLETIAADLSRLDGNSAADLLDQPLQRFGGAYRQLPSYVAVVLADGSLRAAGLLLEGRERLLRTVRHQTRSELVRLPPHLTTEWIIPATIEDRTAAHVAALVLARQSVICRPWLWPGTPDHGRFLVVGERAATHPLARHHRCEGAFDFARIAARLPMPC